MANTRIRKITLCALLVAMALGLSYVERFIPLQLIVPLPGVKLGLANVVTMLALYFLGAGPAFTVLIVRCVLGSIFGGGLSGLAFSLTGGLLAMAVMALTRRIPFLSIYGVSIFGAAAHNMGQILAAVVMLGSWTVTSYLPLLLCTAVATGFVTGAISSATFRALLATGQIPAVTSKKGEGG